ncbi:MAG: hypothetical protein ACI92W_000588 [Paraglaciecola sp.]|jgi:hypothetical protein
MKTKFILSCVVILSSFWLLGQNNVVNESLIIQKETSVSLPAIFRQYFPAASYSSPLSTSYKPIFDLYKINAPTLVNLPRVVETRIEPVSKWIPIRSHNLKFGVGNLLSSTVQYRHTNQLVSGLAMQAGFRHDANRNGPVLKSQSGQSLQVIDLSLQKESKRLQLAFDTKLDRLGFFYFGRADSLIQNDPLSIDLEGQNLIHLQNNLVVSLLQNEKWFVSSEIKHMLTTYINQDLSENSLYSKSLFSYRWNPQWSLQQEVDYSWMSQQTAVLSKNMTVLRSGSSISYSHDSWVLNGGLQLFQIQESEKTSNKTFLTPTFTVKYISNQIGQIELGLTSSASTNSLGELSQQVAFLSDSIQLSPSVSTSNWFLMYRNGDGKFSYNVALSYENIDQAAFIRNKNTDFSALLLVYEKGNTGKFSTSIGVDGILSGRFSYNASITYRQFFLDSLEAAFHIPSFEIKTKIGYNWSEKVESGFQTIIYQDIAIPSYYIQEEAPSVVDVGIWTHIEVKKNLKAFIEVTNLLNQSNNRYYIYPTRPFLSRIGLIKCF